MRKFIFVLIFAIAIQNGVVFASNPRTQTCSTAIPRSREKNVTAGNSVVFRRVIE